MVYFLEMSRNTSVFECFHVLLINKSLWEQLDQADAVCGVVVVV